MKYRPADNSKKMDDDEPVDRTFQNSKALITFGVWLVLMAIGIAVWRWKKKKPSKRDERMKKYQRLNDVEAPHTSAKVRAKDLSFYYGP